MNPSGLALEPTSTVDESRRLLAAALVSLVTIVAFETMSVATIMPEVKADLGGLGWYGWAFSGLALGEVVGIIIAGAWTDRSNPVHPITLGLVVYAVGLVVSGAANSMPMVVGGRVLQGYGAGTVPAVAYVCVARGWAEEHRPRIFAWMSTAWVVPSLIGPAAAGAIAQAVGWRWVFIGLVPVVAVAGAFAYRPIAALGVETANTDEGSLPLDRTANLRRFGLAAIAVAGTAAAMAALQITELLPALSLAVLGAISLGWSFARLSPPGTLRFARGMPSAILVRGTLTFSFLGADAFVSLALTEVRDTSVLFAGIALSSSAVTWTIASWISARTVNTVGARRLVVTGLAVVACGIAVMAVTVATQVPVGLAVVAWLIGGFGIGLAYAPLSQVVLSESPPTELGVSTSALQLSDVLGTALGAGIAGALVAFADREQVSFGGSPIETGLAAVWLLTGAVAVVGAVGALRLPAQRVS